MRYSKPFLLSLLLIIGIFPFTAPRTNAGAFIQLKKIWSDFIPVHQPAPYPVTQGFSRQRGLQGEELFLQLHEQTTFQAPPSGHAYLDAKKYMFSVADNQGCDGKPGILEFYSQICVKGSSEHGADYKETGDQNDDGTVDKEGMNAEHSWPQAAFNKQIPMRSDLHHIFPTFMTPNNTRGNTRFAIVSKAVYSTNNGTKLGSEGFEPADAVKGDIARAILYFVTRYYDINIRQGINYRDFWTSRVQMFLDWNRQDPPDEAEKKRNDLIEKYQGNRNPFVDDTTLADQIGKEVFASH